MDNNEDTRIEINNFYQIIKEAKEAVSIIQDRCPHEDTISKKKSKKNMLNVCKHCDKEINAIKKVNNHA